MHRKQRFIWFSVQYFIDLQPNNSAYEGESIDTIGDTILYDSYLPSQSVMRLEQYLEEDVRLDMDALGELDIRVIEACAQSGGKEQILNNLIKIIKKL